MIARLFKRLLYGGSNSLRAYEASCFRCLRNALSPEAQSILDSQLQAVELIQRFSDDKLVTLHLARGAGETRHLFPNQAPELYAAKMVISGEREKRLLCEFVFHEGHISSLEFNRSPRKIDPEAVCANVEVLEDLMTSPSASDDGSGAVEGNVLATIRKHATISDVTAPATARQREAFFKRLAFVVPEDYAALLGETNGFAAGGWKFLGTRARKIVLTDRTYFLAAEREDSEAALCFRDGEQFPHVVLYDEINDDDRPLGEHFVDALLKVVRESPYSPPH